MKKHSKEELLNDKSSHMGARFMYSFGMAFIILSFIFLMYSTTAFIICMAVGLFLFFKGKKEYNLFMEKNKLKQKMYATPVKTKIVASGISKKPEALPFAQRLAVLLVGFLVLFMALLLQNPKPM